MPDGNRSTSGESSGVPRATRSSRYASSLQEAFERLLARDLLWAVVFVVLLVPVVTQQECGMPASDEQVGEVAASTIKAPYDIEVLDEKATLKRREDERQSVRPVYDFVVSLQAEQKEKIHDLFDKGREAMAGIHRQGAAAQKPDPETLARVTAALGIELPANVLTMLVRHGFSEQTEDLAVKIQSAIAQGRIVGSKDGLPDRGAIVVREVRPGTTVESEYRRLDQIRDLGEARDAIRERIDAETPDWPEADRRALASLLDRFVTSNLSYNASETERRRSMAMASVPEVFMRIPRGRVIIREGEVYTPDVIDILRRIRGGERFDINWTALAGNTIILSLMLLFLHRYVLAHQRLFRRVKNLYTLVLCVSLFVVMATWVGAFVADAVADRITMAPFNEPSSYYWALPVASGAMLLTLLANGRVATVASAVIAVLHGMVLDWNAQAMVFALVSSFAGIYGISKYQKRTAIIKASALVALVNAGLVLALSGVEGTFAPPGEILFQMLAAAAGGVLVAPVVSFSLPMLEWLYNVLTDIRLLELSNLDNPLLRQLSLQAPGTYNHSIIVGTLAEQAAERIGAHALLCRVSANYHDIGKMSKPGYFVENMREGANRHDRLSPRMSSLIIANHVKEGLRLAEAHNLPRQIRDMIPQHHGTRLITYFFRKAKRKEDPDVPEIHESDYRYPGPRPQSKEAAILMMADSVEAAARTVEEPTPAKFEEVINAVTNAIILDHQLDECDLTFSDLGRIRGSFLKSLAAVHHHRIDYPGFVFDRSRPRAVEAE